MKKKFYLSCISLYLGVSTACFSSTPHVTIAVDSFTDRWFPGSAAGTFNNWILLHVGRRLIDSHFSNMISGDLASQWIIGPDLYSVQFILKNNLGTFCDGTPVTPELIIESLLETKKLSEKGRLGFFFNAIKSIEKTNKGITVSFKTKASQWLRFFADPAITIFKKLPPHSKLPCFSGNYTFNSANRKSVTITRKSDQITFQVLAMPFETAVEEFKKGKVHIIPNYSFYQNKILNDLEMKSLIVRDGKIYFYALNNKSPTFKNKEERINFFNCIQTDSLSTLLKSHSIDFKTSFFDKSLNKPSVTIPQKKPLNNQSNTCNTKNFKNLKLITQAGHQMGQIIDASFDKTNKPKIMELEKENFISTVQKGNYDVVLMGLSMISRDYGSVTRLFEKNNLWNLAKISSLLIDSHLLSFHSSERITDKLNAFFQLEELSKTEAYYFPFGYQPTTYGISKKLKTTLNFENTDGRGASVFLNLNYIVKVETE